MNPSVSTEVCKSGMGARVGSGSCRKRRSTATRRQEKRDLDLVLSESSQDARRREVLTYCPESKHSAQLVDHVGSVLEY